MSQNKLEMDENEIHYVYGDQEYVLGQEGTTSELGDLICADGSRAILVDGQYIVTDSQTILLQDSDSNLTQYYINEHNEGFVVGDEDNSVNKLFNGTEILQLVEEDTSDGQQIIYYTNEDGDFATQDVPDESSVEGIQDEDGNIYPLKRIKLEGQLLNFDELLHKQEESLVTSEESSEERNDVQYAVVHVVNADQEESTNETCDMKSESQLVDLSKITGRNLITGQTVTLHSYMEKLKKKLRNHNDYNLKKRPSKKVYNDNVKKTELNDLLDRKIAIGKTKTGKKIVGKIIRIEKKTDAKNVIEEEDDDGDHLVISDSEILNENPGSSAPVLEDEDLMIIESSEQKKVLVKKCSISREGFEQISKTLGGVMEMVSVRKKLENKNIVVKLVEKKYASDTDTFIKSTSYSYGYMEKDVCENEGDEVVEKWKFVLDQTTQDALLGDHIVHEGVDGEKNKLPEKKTKFPITTSLTIVISYGKGGNKTIRVNLNPAPSNLCTICAQYFKTNSQLRHHMNNVHNAHCNNMLCEVCDQSFEDTQKFQEHRNVHVQEGKLFICSECNKCFLSQSKLHKHSSSHDLDLRPLECSVCEVRCASEWALKKHLLTHTGIKPFSCDICHKQFVTQYDVNFHKKIHFPDKHFACPICLRTFSRHSNLLRHTEIHKGSGALYKCEICYCSYNYISSLTRHMVQNHIDATDFRKRVHKV